MAKNSSSLIDKIWNLFSSMKLGLALLGIIAVVAGIGTVIPQGMEDQAEVEAVDKIWQTLGFTHTYSTIYFRMLLGLLCLNLLICSAQRFRGIYLMTFRPDPPRGLANIPQKVCRELEGNNFRLKQEVQITLRARGYFLKIEENEGCWNIVGIKRRWGSWGSFITHLSFIIIIFGALIGSLNGFKGFMLVAVGTTNPIQSVQVQKGIVTDDFSVKINSFEPRFLANGDRENWYTDLSIINHYGKEVARQTISTNHPFTYNGMTFYQSSWAIGFTIDFDGNEYQDIMYEGSSTGLFNLPETDIYLNLQVDQNLRNPSVYYQVYKGSDQVQEGQIQVGQTVDMQDKCKVTVDGWATGLRVKRDPGVSVIFFGSGLMLLGLLLSFYWRPVKISGVFAPADNDTGKLTIGVTTGKVVLEPAHKELAEITEKIVEALRR